MTLIACKECGENISSTAKACPKCGAKVPRAKLWLWIPLGLVIGVPLLLLIIGALGLGSDSKSRDRLAYQECQNNLGRATTSDERGLITGACAMLAEDFRKKHGHRP